MGKHTLRLLQFALKFPDTWHTWGKDRSTCDAVRDLTSKGLLVTNENRQFRLALPDAVKPNARTAEPDAAQCERAARSAGWKPDLNGRNLIKATSFGRLEFPGTNWAALCKAEDIALAPQDDA